MPAEFLNTSDTGRILWTNSLVEGLSCFSQGGNKQNVFTKLSVLTPWPNHFVPIIMKTSTGFLSPLYLSV